jgi:hypothetical protein
VAAARLTCPRPLSAAEADGAQVSFTPDGRTLVVTEAFGGRVGAAAASSYRLNGAPGLMPVSGSVQNTRSEVCWAPSRRTAVMPT